MRTLISFTGDGGMPTIYRKGGGGGGTQTSTSGIPDEFKPYVTEGLKDAQTAYKAGALSEVAGLTPEQQEAFGRRKELGGRGGIYDQLAQDSYGAAQAYRDAASGQGLFGADALGKQTQALEDTIGEAQRTQLGQLQGQSALGGSLGSARNQAGINQALTQTAGNIAAQELSQRRQAALGGAQGVIGSGSQIGSQFGRGAAEVGTVGDALQQQQQNELDRVHQGLSRFFGYLGSPAVGQKSTTTTSGGGK